MRTLYIVQGSTGEYSDFQDWMVCGYFDHAKATARRNDLERIARELQLYESRTGYSTGRDYALRVEALKKLQQHDEHAECDYTGITYFITECPVED